ncbi:DUF2784 family protein [Lyngbya aestuarii]|uniref:DUF2784 family protein n=1 Tax=Lyngbya aestuarii TaxID=118322 RepID=UPI00403E1D6E
MKQLTDLMITVLKAVHLAVLLFVIFGWILPIKLLLLLHIVFVPLMILQWQFNQGTCFLTNIENQLRGEGKEKQQQQGQFIKSLLGKCFNPLPSDSTIKLLIYGIIGLSWGISLIRVFLFSG